MPWFCTFSKGLLNVFLEMKNRLGLCDTDSLQHCLEQPNPQNKEASGKKTATLLLKHVEETKDTSVFLNCVYTICLIRGGAG